MKIRLLLLLSLMIVSVAHANDFDSDPLRYTCDLHAANTFAKQILHDVYIYSSITDTKKATLKEKIKGEILPASFDQVMAVSRGLDIEDISINPTNMAMAQAGDALHNVLYLEAYGYPIVNGRAGEPLRWLVVCALSPLDGRPTKEQIADFGDLPPKFQVLQIKEISLDTPWNKVVAFVPPPNMHIVPPASIGN